MYGGRTLAWETIWKANVWSKYCSFEVSGTQHANLALIWTGFAELCDPKCSSKITTKTNIPAQQAKLLTLVSQGLNMIASDPRDHIYGVYGLLEVAPSVEYRWDRLIYPDYHKLVSELFVDFTVWVISGPRPLRTLSAIQTIRGHTWQTLDCTGSEKLQPHDQPPSDHLSWAM